MPLKRHQYTRKSSQRYWKTGSSLTARSINWVAVGATVAVLAALVVGVVLLSRGCDSEASAAPDVTLPTSGGAQGAGATQNPGGVTPPPPAPPPARDGSSEQNALDLSQEAVQIASSRNNVNRPGIFGDELVYSAGSGPVTEPVLTNLFLFNLKTMEETQLSKVTVKNGEIYETYINTDYIVWLDTNQQGINRLFYMRRNNDSILDGEMPTPEDVSDPAELSMTPTASGDASASPSPSPSASPTASAPEITPDPNIGEDGMPIERQLKESGYHMPTLRLSGDYLIWNEQDSEKMEVLYLVDLISEENVALPGYTESIEGFEDTYAVSAPDIHGREVIWAAPDLSDPTGRNSLIYSCDLERLSTEAGYETEKWQAGMYVHDPLTNGKAWAWIDTNHEPIQNLYLKYGDEVTLVSQSTLDGIITNYCLGDDMLVYTKGGHIWVYFYESGQYGRVTADGETGRQPVTYGRRVVWFTDSVEGKDQLKVVYIP